MLLKVIYTDICFLGFTYVLVQLVLFDHSNNTGAIDAKMDGSVLEEKSSFKMVGWLSLLNRTRALKLSLLLKLFPRKLKPWFVPWSLFLLRLLSHMPMHGILLSCLIWWELLDKLQKQIWKTVGPPEPLAHQQNIDSLSLFYSYYFDEWSSELAQLVPLPSLFFKEAYLLFW